MNEKLPDRCCGNCAHGRAVPDPANLRVMVRCKAGPPSAQQETVLNFEGREMGKKVSATWPVLVATEECDAFTPKIGIASN
jgi:hypothetical protein